MNVLNLITNSKSLFRGSMCGLSVCHWIRFAQIDATTVISLMRNNHYKIKSWIVSFELSRLWRLWRILCCGFEWGDLFFHGIDWTWLKCLVWMEVTVIDSYLFLCWRSLEVMIDGGRNPTRSETRLYWWREVRNWVWAGWGVINLSLCFLISFLHSLRIRKWKDRTIR